MNVLLYGVFYLLRVFELIVLALCILSFIPGLRDSGVFKFLYWLTEPVLSPVRSFLGKFLPENVSAIDFSPIAVYFIIILARSIIVSMM